MNNLSTTLQAPTSYDELEYRVRDAAHHGVASANSLLDAMLNTAFAVLSSAFPAPGDGMH